MMNETNEYTDYLKDVIFINEDDDYRKLNENDDLMLKNDIMKNSFSSEDLDVRDIDYFKNAYQVISQNIPKTNKKTDQWQSCVKDCYNNIETYMENEMKSTSYMLRLLTASVLGNTSDYKIVFLIKFDNSQSFKSDIKDPNCYVDSPVDMIDKNKKNRGICYYTTKNMKGNPFTGKWNDDAHFFNIGIMKNDKLLQTQNKKKETYLKIHVPKNNTTVIDNTILKLEQMEREYINTISPLQSPFYKSLWGEKEYSNVMNDINKKITRLPYLKYKNDRVLKPRDKNIQDANKIIELLKLMKAFKNYTLVEQSLGIPHKDEENGNYYISSGVLYNGRDTGFDLDPNQKRGLPSDGSLFNRKQQDLYDLGINVNISKKLSDGEYRKIILDLIDALRKIKKNDNFDYNEINGNPTSDVSKIEIGEIPPNPFLKETYPTIEYTDESNGRFIFGAGPSASGKTYNAGLVVKMMKMVDPSFPEFFMTIDGGTYRDVSVIYQSIIRAILEKSQYPGLKNLMSASIFSMEKSIFESDSIKKNIKEYLLKQTRQYNFIVSLYVPDTLAFCGSLDCMNKIIPYIEITGDNNWIGLMIYQHKNGGNKCPFKSGYKCKGCSESGKEREKKEGKKYSSSAWDKSVTNGLISIKNAPNIRIVYHNNGGVTDSKSVFEDLSNEYAKIPFETDENIKDFFDKNNIVYIGGELKNREDCHTYLLTGCSDTYFQDTIAGLNPFGKKDGIDTSIVPIVQDDSVISLDETTKKSDISSTDNLIVNAKILEYYNNKYIGIPKELTDSDEADEENTQTINHLINTEFLELIDVDETNTNMSDDEKKYNFYNVIIKSPFDPTKNNDYEMIQNLINNNKIKLYESYDVNKTEPIIPIETTTVEGPVIETSDETTGSIIENKPVNIPSPVIQPLPIDIVPVVPGYDNTNKELQVSSTVLDNGKLTLNIDTKILEYYNNKYIRIPNEFMESENEEQSKIIKQLVDSGFLELADVDKDGMTDDEKTHHYFSVIINPPFDPKKNEDYIIIQKLITNDKIKLFDSYEEKEPDKNSTKLADTNTVPIVPSDTAKESNISSTIVDDLIVDTKILEYYNNKYIGIPKELTDSDEANEENTQTVDKLVTMGFLELVGLDETIMDDYEKKYNYYHVIIKTPLEPKKKNDYIMIQKLINNDKIKLYENYEEKKSSKSSTEIADTNIVAVLETPLVEKVDETRSSVIENIPVIPPRPLIPPPPHPNDNEEFENIQTIVVPGDIDIGFKYIPEDKSTTKYKFPSFTSILNKITNALPSLNISFSKNKENIEKDISEIQNDIVNVEKQIVNEKPVTIVSVKMTDPKTSEKVNDIVDTGAALDITEIYNKKISDDNLIYQNPLKQFTDHANIDIVPVVHGVIAKLLDYCKDKYIGIPKNLEDNDKKIINNLETNRYIKKIEEDKIDQNKLKGNEANYDYYEIILDDKMKEIIQQFYEDLQKLSVLNSVIVYERGDETTSSETTSDIVSQPKVKKSNIGNLLNVFKDVNNMSSSDFFNSLGNISKHMIIGSKTQKNKANGIPVNIGPKCKNPNLTKKSYFGIGNMFGAGKKKRTRKNNPKSKRTKKNRN